MPADHSSIANDIRAVADLLRGDFKQSRYGRVILPFVLLRRLPGYYPLQSGLICR